MTDLTAELRQTRLIAVLRHDRHVDMSGVVATLRDVGLAVIELTMSTPGCLEELERLAGAHGKPALLGVGTVTTSDEVRAAVGAGAEFIVTPGCFPDVIETSVAAGIPVVGGGLTPTELWLAHRAGATAVKVFPASLGGPGYLRALRGPFGALSLVPTGGIGLGDAREYLDAGALAIGTGSQLTGDVFDTGDLDALWRRATKLVSVVKEAAL